MAAGFDPYHRWLSIPPSEQPPNHYRLLGLQTFEASVEVIENAAARQAGHVRGHLQSPLRAYAVSLLREIEVARLCLLDAETKAGYDAWLKGRIAPAIADVSRSLPETWEPAAASFAAPADFSWPPAGHPTDSQMMPGAMVLSSPRIRRRRRRSPLGLLLLWVAGGAMGLLAGYAILCMIDPHYDFLNLVLKGERVALETVPPAASPSATKTAPPRQPAAAPRAVERPSRRASSGLDASSDRAHSMTTEKVSEVDDAAIAAMNAAPPPAEVQVPIQADLKPVLLPFDLKKRVMRVVAAPGEPLSPNIVCDVEGSRELNFAPLLKVPLGEKRTILFSTDIRDTAVGAEIEFLKRNDLVVVEVRPKYRLPSGDEEALYKAAGLRKVKLVSSQFAAASNAQQALPQLQVALSRLQTEYQSVLPIANSAATGRGYLQITAAQLRLGALKKQGADMENQIRDAETLAAKLPHLRSDLAAVRGLGEWSAQVATTAALSVSIHVDGVGLLAEVR